MSFQLNRSATDLSFQLNRVMGCRAPPYATDLYRTYGIGASPYNPVEAGSFSAPGSTGDEAEPAA